MKSQGTPGQQDPRALQKTPLLPCLHPRNDAQKHAWNTLAPHSFLWSDTNTFKSAGWKRLESGFRISRKHCRYCMKTIVLRGVTETMLIAEWNDEQCKDCPRLQQVHQTLADSPSNRKLSSKTVFQDGFTYNQQQQQQQQQQQHHHHHHHP